jgi:hypothetical protein
MTRIFCGFTFYNELDLLELRLAEIYPYVDHVVLVESAVTYSGQPKPLHYAEHRRRFERFQGKLHHVVAPPSAAEDSWSREAQQNNWIWEGVQQLHPAEDDILIFSDMDEIPDLRRIGAEVVPGLRSTVRICSHWFHFDWRNYLGRWNDTIWVTRVGTVSAFRAQGNDLRLLPGDTHPEPLGWHLSFFGMAAEQVQDKLRAYSHHKDERERALLAAGAGEIRRRMAAGGHLFGDVGRQPFDGPYPGSCHADRHCCCCFNDILLADRACSKGHFTCARCAAQMQRSDCLLCNPHAAVVDPPRTRSGTPNRRSGTPNRRERKKCPALETLLCTILILLEIVLTVILLGYMGKCYVWIYIHLCNYDEPAWFGWDQFRYIVAEAAGGALATMVLMGCCVKD